MNIFARGIKMAKIIGIYRNGNYFVEMYEDGTKVRISKDNKFIPEFAECIDMTITKKCDGGCEYCYMGCTPEGRHCSVSAFEAVVDTLHPYTELALNVNDLTHPRLQSILRMCRDKNIITNITINQKHFMKNVEKLLTWEKQRLFYGIGISYTHIEDGFTEAVLSFENPVVHVISGIFEEKDLDFLKNQGLKILILGYKETNRGAEYKEYFSDTIDDNIKWLKNNIKNIFDNKYFETVCFDNEAIYQLNVAPYVPKGYWDEHFMGEEGEFTFYIDVVDRMFALNSMTESLVPFGQYPYDTTLMFQYIREKYYGR